MHLLYTHTHDSAAGLSLSHQAACEDDGPLDGDHVSEVMTELPSWSWWTARVLLMNQRLLARSSASLRSALAMLMPQVSFPLASACSVQGCWANHDHRTKSVKQNIQTNVFPVLGTLYYAAHLHPFPFSIYNARRHKHLVCTKVCCIVYIRALLCFCQSPLIEAIFCSTSIMHVPSTH